MTHSPFATRSVLLALLLGVASAAACIDEEVLENEECLSDDDCFSSQECTQTSYQTMKLGNVGWCRSDGNCLDGEQPGCSCVDDVTRLCCTGSYVMATGMTVSLVPHENPSAGCICVLPDDPQFAASPNIIENTECIPKA